MRIMKIGGIRAPVFPFLFSTLRQYIEVTMSGCLVFIIKAPVNPETKIKLHYIAEDVDISLAYMLT